MKYDAEDMWKAFAWGWILAAALSGNLWVLGIGGAISVGCLVWFEIYKTPEVLQD
jgi:hypothetical protein